MSRCTKCNVEILDETDYCPLCKSVLEKSVEMENMYPDARVISQKYASVLRFYTFFSIVVELVLINIVLLGNKNSLFAIIPGLVFGYGYAIIRYAIIGRMGYRSKILLLTVIAVLVLVAIDYVTDYHKWSVNYIIPAGIMFVDAGVLLATLVNRRNWQSYLSIQVVMLLCCVAGWILFITNVITQELVLIIATDLTIILFLGTVIIGGRRARVELYRRFHF